MTVRSDLDWLGTADCGLIGPNAFAFQNTFARRRDGRRSCRNTAHHHLQLMLGQALFVEAVDLPMRRIRHAAFELVETVWELFFFSSASDPSILCAAGINANWDLLRLITPQLCPRDGTRLLLERVRHRFARRYSAWQRLALKNGRFFPPPNRLELTVNTGGSVQLLMSWSAGFSPDNKVWVTQRVADVSSGEPVLQRHARRVTEWR